MTVQPCLWVACSCVKLCCSNGILFKDVLASVKTSCVMGLFQNVLWAFAMAPFRHLWLHYKWTIWFVLRENKKRGTWVVNSVIVYVPYLNHNQAIYCMLNVSLCINSLYFCICLLINSLGYHCLYIWWFTESKWSCSFKRSIYYELWFLYDSLFRSIWKLFHHHRSGLLPFCCAKWHSLVKYMMYQQSI